MTHYPVPSRTEFETLLRSVLPQTLVWWMMLAYDLSEAAHAGKTRDSGNPYFDHVVRTVCILVFELGVLDPVSIITMLFHDVPENEHEFISVQAIAVLFRVGHIEGNLANNLIAFNKRHGKKPNEPDESAEENTKRIREEGTGCCLCKLTDGLDNLRDIFSVKNGRLLRKIHQTKHIYPQLIEDVRARWPERADYLQAEMDKALILAEQKAKENIHLGTA